MELKDPVVNLKYPVWDFGGESWPWNWAELKDDPRTRSFIRVAVQLLNLKPPRYTRFCSVDVVIAWANYNCSNVLFYQFSR